MKLRNLKNKCIYQIHQIRDRKTIHELKEKIENCNTEDQVIKVMGSIDTNNEDQATSEDEVQNEIEFWQRMHDL